MSRDEGRQLERIGYWWDDDQPKLPHPKQFVDSDWDQRERAKVVTYLKESYSMPYAAAGYSWCRFKCGEKKMGSREFTDGAWLYPEGFVHYIEKHDVKPPTAFLDHLRSKDFEMSNLPILDTRS